MKHGYKRALADGADIIVKIDADGQMDPSHIPVLIAPILCADADYTKGNRFAPASRMPNGSCPRAIRLMPWRRRIANAALSAFHRAATGYWRIGDPANGYTAIRADALRQLGLDALEDCFFFETDMLYRLNLIGAAVKDVPLPAIYPGGPSTLSVRRVAPRFALLIADRWLRRVRARLFADSSRRSTAAAR
jgi:hypothetical protein